MPQDATAAARSPDPDPLPAEYGWLRMNDLAVPVLPTVAHRVIDLASNPDSPLHTIASLVSKDQVIAARVLGMANSAYSSPLQNISTVTEAVVRLGSSAVRNVVLTVCLASRMQDPAVYGRRGRELAHHAVGTAYLARLTAERARVNADEAFLYGLLHDIGKLVILRQAHDHQKRTRETIDPAIVELALLERHAALGARALRRWQLPDSLDEPVMFHHDCLAAPRRRREAAVAYVANHLAHRYRFGCDSYEHDLLTDLAAQDLGLDADWLAGVDQRAPGLVEIARQVLG